MFREWTCIWCNCKRNRPKGQIFELQSHDQKRPDFFQTKFQGNHSEKCVGVSLFLRFQLKNVYTRPDFDFWAFCDPALKTEWIMEQLPKPHKRTQKCIQRKSDWFHRVLCFFEKAIRSCFSSMKAFWFVLHPLDLRWIWRSPFFKRSNFEKCCKLLETYAELQKSGKFNLKLVLNTCNHSLSNFLRTYWFFIRFWKCKYLKELEWM